MKQYFTIDQWLGVLRRAANEDGGLLPLAVLSRLSGLKGFTLRKALLRAQSKALVQRVGRGLYLNSFGAVTIEEMATAIGRPCYISFESALADYGILSQEPLVLTCATTGKSGHKKTPLGEIVFRHISRKYFWGFVSRNRVLWSEPEKAILDWLYWSAKIHGPPNLDEINWDQIDWDKILSYSERFPGSVRRLLPHGSV